MSMPLSRLAVAVAMLCTWLACPTAVAQYDDYDDYAYYMPCQHAGPIEAYSIVRYREGLQAWETSREIHGRVLMSQSCIAVESGRLEMNFVIDRIEKHSSAPRFYSYYRSNPDDYCDYMEMRDGIGRDRGLIYLLFGNYNKDNDCIERTQLLVVKPMKIEVTPVRSK